MKKNILRALAMLLTMTLLLTSGLADTLRYPDRGDDVVRLQQALTQTGHYSGLIDGQYGTGTRAAVEAFQRAYGLTPDGVAGKATQKKLRELTGINISDDDDDDAGNSGSTLPGSATGLFKGDYSKLAFGSEGERVRILQRALMALGFSDITKVDGDFGTATYKAVKAFQQTVGLTVDGKAGPNTLKKLETYFDKDGNALSGPIVTQTPSNDEDLKYDVPTRTLRKGMSGLDVQYTQYRLSQLKYYSGALDGQFGSAMYSAVKAFQQRNKLTADGVIGAGTRKVLFSDGAIAADETVVNPETHRTLRLGMEGDDVAAVQRRLKELGYYSKTVDGQYGSGTVTAVKAFQGRNGLKVDGVCGEDTIEAIYSDDAIDAGSSITTPPAASTTEKPTRTLKKGDSGNDVISVQNRLKALGYYTIKVDGQYGSGTVSAVKYFQARNGLTVDGKVGKQTVAVLYSASAIPAGSSTETSTPTQQPAATPERTLRYGDSGEDVVLLQVRLIALGYLSGSADGKFGSATSAAVSAFQLRNGLTADGVAGAKTYKKLFSDDAIEAAPVVSPETPSSGLPTRELSNGSSGEDVKLVQTRLKALGYLNGTSDGCYGPQTTAAMMAFQVRNGLTATGNGNSATYQKLFSADAIAADTPQEEEETANYTTLTLGSTGNAVIRLQQMLSSLKYTVNVTGTYDETTYSAVLAFQLRNGLTTDGIAGKQTQTKLYSGNCITGDTAIPGEGGTGSGAGNGGGPAISQVKLLHWFDDIKPTIKSGQVVLVYEPASNSSFYLRLYSLGRHADSEPLTANDTAIMKAAWGGTFSWSEKPVYVRLPNGTWCIASMHSMPHLSGALDNNNFEGHLCVHFPRTMTECAENDPKNGVRHQNDIRKHWKKITGEDIPW